MTRFWYARGSTLLLAIAAATTVPVMAKPPKPSNGSWRIVPVTLTEPLKVAVDDKMKPILVQRLVPEAAVLTSAPVQYASHSLAPDAALIKATTKQGTAWCSIDPLRSHPGNPKTSFGEAMLMGRKIVERRETPCFADTNGDGLMDSAMIGSDRGYVVPTIDKLGKPTPVTPFAVRETDAAAVISYPLVLQAGLIKFKNEAPSLIFSLSVSSNEYSSQISGYRLVGGPDDRTSFAGFSGLATIDTKFEEPVPALYTLGSISADGSAVVTITQTISARRFTLDDISTF